MKKGFIIMVMLVLFVMIPLCSPTGMVAYAAADENLVVTLSAKVEGDAVTVNANLRQNSGTNGLTVEIIYDKSVMTLTNVVRGKALSSLEYLTTNVNTEQGYAITPFRINWSGDDNDFTTGTLIKMTFKLKDDVPDGDYRVTLKTDNRQAVTYIDENGIKAKNILIDDVYVRLRGDKVSFVDETNDTEEELPDKAPDIVLIVVVTVSSVCALAAIIVVIILIKKKGKKSWKKVE